MQTHKPTGKKRDAFLAAEARGAARAWLRPAWETTYTLSWLWSSCAYKDFHHPAWKLKNSNGNPLKELGAIRKTFKRMESVDVSFPFLMVLERKCLSQFAPRISRNRVDQID